MPILPVDYSDDWQHADGVETFTLTRRHPTVSSITGLKGVRTSVTETAASLGGDYGPEPRSFLVYLWTDGLGSAVPNQGDILIDSEGVNYVITQTSLRSDQTQWSLSCVRAT
jgi:hypothetical protein